MLARVIFLSILENAISRFIALDPDAPQVLEPIKGKVIAIRCQRPDWTFYLCPSDHTIQLLEAFAGKPDTVLSGTPLDFLRLGLSKNPLSDLFTGQVKIEGDMETGRAFQTLFERLDIDWEEPLARLTGDVAAHRIGTWLRGGAQWGRESAQALKLNLTEYLQEEHRDLPTNYECEEWFKEVDDLRADADRLDARIRRLLAGVSEVP